MGEANIEVDWLILRTQGNDIMRNNQLSHTLKYTTPLTHTPLSKAFIPVNSLQSKKNFNLVKQEQRKESAAGTPK